MDETLAHVLSDRLVLATIRTLDRMRGSVDVEVARWCAEHRTDLMTDVFRVLQDVGESPLFFVGAGIVAVALALVLRLRTGLLRVIVALSVTLTVTGPLKSWIDRPRPPYDLAITHLSGPAMPSSHAIFTSAAVVVVVMAPWWTSRHLRVAAAVVGGVGCLLAGVAMIYLGGHWLSDVLVGWALGVGITAGSMLLLRRIGMS
jgi:membrane-associated phospholipid phosphatase